MFQSAKSITKLFSCSFCDVVFWDNEELTTHFKETHSSAKPNVNDATNVKTASLNASFGCPQCPAKFLFAYELVKHSKSVHFKPPERRSCPECRRTFHSEFDLEDHIKAEHNFKQKPPEMTFLRCSECPARFSNRSDLETHQSNSHYRRNPDQPPKDAGQEPELLQCPDCPSKFQHQNLFERHCRFSHSKKIEDGSSPAKDATSTQQLATASTHSSGSSQPLSRAPDQQTSSTLSTAPRTKPIQCPRCPTIFTKQHIFDNHFAEAHGNANPASTQHGNMQEQAARQERPKEFSCAKCGIKFPQNYLLDRHVDMVHQGNGSQAEPVQVVAKQREFRCDVCSQTFPHMYLLTRHQENEHSGRFLFLLKFCFLLQLCSII